MHGAGTTQCPLWAYTDAEKLITQCVHNDVAGTSSAWSPSNKPRSFQHVTNERGGGSGGMGECEIAIHSRGDSHSVRPSSGRHSARGGERLMATDIFQWVFAPRHA